MMSSPKREVYSCSGGSRHEDVPINSRRLMAETLRWIAKALGLPTNTSKAEMRQMIEGRLAEAHEPRNVLVDVIESAPDERTIKLRYEGGVILEATASEEAGEGREPSSQVEEAVALS